MAYSLLLLPLILGVVWCGTMRLLAWSGGWSRLAAAFPGQASARGARIFHRWIGVGWVDYNGCVNYTADEGGLHIALWPIFNFAHPPLYIPWTAMRAEDVRKVFGRRGQVVTLAIGDPVITKIKLPEVVFEAGSNVLRAPAPEN